MGIVVGSLARQNWHRQVRHLGLSGEAALNHVIDKTVAFGREFGFRPMGIDVGLRSLPHADDAYIDELKARLREGNLIPVVGFAALAVSNDEEVRRQSLEEARRNLGAVAALGAQTATFSCALNGRITRQGQLRIASDMLRQLGPSAAQLGIRICQENYCTFTSDQLAEVCRRSQQDNVGVLSDTGNWLILEEDPTTATETCLPYTMHAHVRDYVLETDTYNGVAVGEGLVDFEALLPVLAQATQREDIIWSVEVDTDDRDEDQCVHDSYHFIKDWLVRNGHTEHLHL